MATPIELSALGFQRSSHDHAPSLTSSCCPGEPFCLFTSPSPLSRQDGAGWGDAAAPGERARQADVTIDGHPGRLHDVLRGTGHTVLLFTGWDDQARPAVELVRLAERIERTYPDLVTARVVSAERYADHPATVGDHDRRAHRRYGVERASAFVIRPDLHIGYRGHPIDADAIMANLAARRVGGDRHRGSNVTLLSF